MFNNKNKPLLEFRLTSKKVFFIYLLVNVFLSNAILPFSNSIETKQLNELEQYLNEETNKKSNNQAFKKATSKNIKDLSNQIFKTISERKKNIIKILSNLENLFIEIQNLNTKNGSLKKIKREINKIKKQINKYTKDKNNIIKQIYIDKINFSVESIEFAIYQKNEIQKSFIKKIINTTIWALITSASIAGTVFYSNSKNPKKESADFFNSVVNKIKEKINSSPNSKESETAPEKEENEPEENRTMNINSVENKNKGSYKEITTNSPISSDEEYDMDDMGSFEETDEPESNTNENPRNKLNSPIKTAPEREQIYEQETDTEELIFSSDEDDEIISLNESAKNAEIINNYEEHDFWDLTILDPVKELGKPSLIEKYILRPIINFFKQ